MNKTVRWLVILMAGLMIGLSGFQLYSIFSEYAAGESGYDQLTSQFVRLESSTQPIRNQSSEANPSESHPENPVQVDLPALASLYPDVVGWIYSDNGKINYPIVRGKDNQQYLHRMVDGTENKAGSIFMDSRNQAAFSDYHTILYGHNMKNDSMFGTLPDYSKPGYFETHPMMWLITPNITFRLDLFAGFVTPADSETYQLISDAGDLPGFIQAMKARSDFQSPISTEAAGQIVTLSTCAYDFDEARYVVLAMMTPVQ